MGIEELKASSCSAKSLTAQHLYIKDILIRFLSFSLFIFCLWIVAVKGR